MYSYRARDQFPRTAFLHSVLHYSREHLAISVGVHTCRKEAAAFGFGDVGQE